MGMGGARNLLKVRAALLMVALALVLLVGVLPAKPAHAKSFTVNSTNHPGSGVCDATECTLKEAINEANTNAESDTVGFASGLGREIELSAATGGFFIQNDTPAVDAPDVRIKGPGGGLTIDGNGQAQVFVIQAPTSQTSGAANAAIEGLTIKNGFAPGTPSLGGGIYNGGTLTLTNSTVSGNSAGYGGGIFNAGTGTLTLTNSTVSANTATNSGGGIYNGGDATLANTIVAGNGAPTNPDAQGGFTGQGHNLIGDTEGSSGWVDSDLQDVDPLLGPLQNNGGTTDTHALLPGSPAIDSGTSAGCPATDQRGVARPNDGDKNGTATCDMGSFEVDTTAPRVSAATPTGTGIGRGTNLAATFSEKMDAATINRSTFRLFKVTPTGTTQVTSATVTPSSNGLKATLNPFGTSSTLLAKNTRYKAVLTTGAEDVAGNRLDQNPTKAGDQQKTWTFVTKG